MNATAAALIPMTRVSVPEHHQATGDQRLLIAPAQKKMAPVRSGHLYEG
jgi:hypothetical protein